MVKIVILVFLFTLSASAQQLFESKLKIEQQKDTRLTGPTLYLSRENPMYIKSKTNKNNSKESDEHLSDFYEKYILGLDARPNQNKEPTKLNINRPTEVSNNSPLNKHFENNYVKSKTSYEEKTPPDGQYILSKNAPFVLENGTLMLGGYKINNNDDISTKLSNINSYAIKNIKIQNNEPIVTKVSTVRFNGRKVDREFIRKYFADALKILDRDLDVASNRRRHTEFVEEEVNKDGFGLIDVRSGFF